MFHQKIKDCFSHAVHLVTSCISEFTVNSDSELSRKRKLPADKLITFLVSQGSSSTKNELLDFFDLDAQAPTASALNQQRAKLNPDALEAVFGHFNHFASFYAQKEASYRFIAADGSSFSFFSRPSFAPPDYFVSEGLRQMGFTVCTSTPFTILGIIPIQMLSSSQSIKRMNSKPSVT